MLIRLANKRANYVCSVVVKYYKNGAYGNHDASVL